MKPMAFAFILAGLPAILIADCVRAEGKLACDSHGTISERDIVCHMTSPEARSFRFKADFSGSHDDTTASLEASLDGQPLQCMEGSKTELAGEDGDVSLLCRFALAGSPDSRRVTVRLSFRHAQFVDFQLAAE